MSADPATAPAAVRLPDGGRRHDLRAVTVVLRRELIRFWQDRMRIVIALVQPALFLFVLGSGLAALTSAGSGGFDLRTFLFPGVLAMSVMMPAMFSAGSIVIDREYGFLREMLVAPVSRTALVVGKCLGGAIVATGQGVLVLLLAPAVGISYGVAWMAAAIGLMFVLAFTLTALGVMVAGRIRSFQGFMALVNMLVMPMLFLSGAMFPLSGLPRWLTVLTHVNPLTYAVDAVRRTVFAHVDISERSRAVLAPGVHWGGWQVPVAAEVAIVAVLGLVLLAVAAAQFRRTE
ncbi:MAG TPA: ABC transporter permease [Pseudonocardiaceae bacterium]